MKHGWSHKRDGRGKGRRIGNNPSNFLAVAVPMTGNVDVTD